MKLSVSAYRAHASAHKKILSSSYQTHYGSTTASHSSSHVKSGLFSVSVANFTNVIIFMLKSFILMFQIYIKNAHIVIDKKILLNFKLNHPGMME